MSVPKGGRCKVCGTPIIEPKDFDFAFCSIECHERGVEIARHVEAVEQVGKLEERIAQQIAGLNEELQKLLTELRCLGMQWRLAIESSSSACLEDVEWREELCQDEWLTLDRRVRKLLRQAGIARQEAKTSEQWIDWLKGKR